MTRILPLSCLCAVLLGSACDDKTSPSRITVSGQVLDDSGLPVANVPVLIFGEGRQPVRTDSTGAFRIPDVTPPYDIAAAGDFEPAGVTVYQGVTRQHLTLFVADSRNGIPPVFSATVKGTVSGGTTPYTDPFNPRVTFLTPGNTASGSGWLEYSSSTGIASGAYSADVRWQGSSSITGSLFAFQEERASGLDVPTRYLGYARRDHVVLTGDATVSQDLPMEPVENSTLRGTVTLPSGYTKSYRAVSIHMASDMNVPLFSDSKPASSSFTYPVPVIPQSSFLLSISADASDLTSSTSLLRKGLLAGAPPLEFVLEAGPTLQEPAHLTADVNRSTGFSWTGGPGRVHEVFFTRLPEVSPLARDVTIITTATQVTLPDLSPLGRALPANARMRWQLYSRGPLASVDELLERQRSRFLGSALWDMTEEWSGTSGQREFVTSDTF